MRKRSLVFLNLAVLLGLVISGLTLSGLGYPNDATVIIGPDSREDAPALYDVRLEVPERVEKTGTLQARVSIESVDGFVVSSEATVNVSGGTLQNEQTQTLSPDALWKIQTSSASLVGVVVSVETKIYPKDKPTEVTTYLDTLSGSVPVDTAGALGIYGTNPGMVSDATKSSRIVEILIVVGVVVIISVVVFVKKQRKNSKEKH
jgi:hypothetical protein